MGRCSKPQRSKKHKKIKAIDPFYAGDRIADRDAGKYNLAPTEKPLEEEFSHSVREIERLKNVAKTMKRKRVDSRMVHEEVQYLERGFCRPMPSAPEFKRRRRETEEAFMRRVDCETKAIIHKAQFDDKYKIGECDPLDKEIRNSKQKKMEETSETYAKKKRRLLEKRENLLLKKLDRMKDKLDKRLAVAIVHDTKETKSKTVPMKWKPGQKSSSRNQKPSEETLLKRQQKPSPLEPKKREVGKTIKSKFLPVMSREALELEREKAIKLYRQKQQEKRFARDR